MACHFVLAWAATAMGTGVWFTFIAWKLGSQPRGMLGVVLLIFAPMLAAAALLARPDAPSEAGTSPAGIIITALHRVDDCLRFVHLCRAHLGVALSFVVILGLCQLWDYVNLMAFLVFYTVTSAMAAVLFLPWLASCERRLHEQRAEYRERLGEVEATAWKPVSGADDVS